MGFLHCPVLYYLVDNLIGVKKKVIQETLLKIRIKTSLCRKKDQQINPQKTITMCGQFRIKRKGKLFEHMPQK